MGLKAGKPSKRKFPRADLRVRAHLSIPGQKQSKFDATLSTTNLSVGGVFVESSYFLKVGTLLDVVLSLPGEGKPVRVRGRIVRVESGGKGRSGFALSFTEYFDGAEVVLASVALGPEVRAFLERYAKQFGKRLSAEYLAEAGHLVSAWELDRQEQ